MAEYGAGLQLTELFTPARHQLHALFLESDAIMSYVCVIVCVLLCGVCLSCMVIRIDRRLE